MDPAVVMAGVMMVKTLVAQIRPLRAAIEKYDVEIERIFRQHPDRAVFESFPGAGKVLAPRLLAAFGADRDRFEAALEIQQFSGIAPVTEHSGKRYGFIVAWRVPSLCFRRFTNLPTSHGISALGPSCTTSSNANAVNTTTQRFGLWRTNGSGLCFGAGKIVGPTTAVYMRNRSSSAERVWDSSSPTPLCLA